MFFQKGSNSWLTFLFLQIPRFSIVSIGCSQDTRKCLEEKLNDLEYANVCCFYQKGKSLRELDHY